MSFCEYYQENIKSNIRIQQNLYPVLDNRNHVYLFFNFSA